MASLIELTREELSARVWLQPMRLLAREFGLSDVGLKKICRRHDIPTPERGYWAKLAYGKTVRREKLPPAKSGQADVVLVRNSGGDGAEESMPSAGLDWIEREHLPEQRVTVGPRGQYRHALVLATEKRLKKEKGDGLIVPPHDCLNVRVSPALFPRALTILDALLTACETRGWPVSVEVPLQRRSSTHGNFWYAGLGWIDKVPAPRRAEAGVLIRRQFVSFSLTELLQRVPPSEADIRAWRKRHPWGVGDPPPRPEPSGELLLEIGDHPWVTTRRRFRDSEKRPLETHLNAILVGFVKMAAGLRAYALREALERRQEQARQRRKREEARRRKELEQNVAHLENGIQRSQWRRAAEDFVAQIKEEGVRRGIKSQAFFDWLDWAERHVKERGLDAFFAPWTEIINERHTTEHPSIL